MSYIQAAILGLVQGLAEFLPISSSGHLVIFKDILGLDPQKIPLAFDVFLHLATLLAVLIVFRARIGAILAALWRLAFGPRPDAASLAGGAKPDPNLALVIPLLAATALTAAMGFLIQHFLPAEGVKAASAELLVTAAVLASTAFLKPGTRMAGEIGVGRGLFIGFAQGLGVFSGISRSGFTIAAGMAAGLDRGLAGEFSFLLAIPAILGASLLSLKDAGTVIADVAFGPLALSFAVAFLSGLAALKLLMRVVRSGKIAWFALYLVPVGIAGLFLL